MKRILVGLVLLGMIAGGAVAWAQVQPSDPLAARIIELQNVYRQVLVDLGSLVDQQEAIDVQITSLEEQKLRLEGGIMELKRYQDVMTPAIPIEELFPNAEVIDTTAVETEPE